MIAKLLRRSKYASLKKLYFADDFVDLSQREAITYFADDFVDLSQREARVMSRGSLSLHSMYKKKRRVEKKMKSEWCEFLVFRGCP